MNPKFLVLAAPLAVLLLGLMSARPEGRPAAVARAGERGSIVEAPAVDATQESPVREVVPPPVEIPATAPKTPARKWYSPYREFGPLDEVDRIVHLTPAQRVQVEGLVNEREAQMHAVYSDAVQQGGDAGRARAVEQVMFIYAGYDDRIGRELSPEQRFAYDEARRTGLIGRPMFVYRHGGE